MNTKETSKSGCSLKWFLYLNELMASPIAVSFSGIFTSFSHSHLKIGNGRSWGQVVDYS